MLKKNTSFKLIINFYHIEVTMIYMIYKRPPDLGIQLGRKHILGISKNTTYFLEMA